jgi:hypothetical protein
LWDGGDCQDVLQAVLARAKIQTGKGNVFGSTILDLIITSQGGYVKRGVFVGTIIVICVGLGCLIGVCRARRRAKIQLTNRKYTPYGQGEGVDGGEPKLSSAIDDDDDE